MPVEVYGVSRKMTCAAESPPADVSGPSGKNVTVVVDSDPIETKQSRRDLKAKKPKKSADSYDVKTEITTTTVKEDGVTIEKELEEEPQQLTAEIKDEVALSSTEIEPLTMVQKPESSKSQLTDIVENSPIVITDPLLSRLLRIVKS